MNGDEADFAWASVRAAQSPNRADRLRARDDMGAEREAWDEIVDLVDSGSSEAIGAIIDLAAAARSGEELYFLGASLGEPFAWAGGNVNELIAVARARVPEFVTVLVGYLK